MASEVLNFFQASLRNCINCVHCDDHFFIFTEQNQPGTWILANGLLYQHILYPGQKSHSPTGPGATLTKIGKLYKSVHMINKTQAPRAMVRSLSQQGQLPSIKHFASPKLVNSVKVRETIRACIGAVVLGKGVNFFSHINAR